MLAALVTLVVETESRDAALLCPNEPSGIGTVGDHHDDLGRIAGSVAASTNAIMLEPRPEIRMATRFLITAVLRLPPKVGDRPRHPQRHFARRLTADLWPASRLPGIRLVRLHVGELALETAPPRRRLCPWPRTGYRSAASISPMTTADLPAAFKVAQHLFSAHAIGDDDHADAAVEGAQHLRVVEVAGRLPANRTRPAPSSSQDRRARQRPVGQHARQVLRQSAPGDVRQRLDRAAGVTAASALSAASSGLT